ncbi:hypothetical protein BD410DRAFT_72211 [Rickenella mellea]|uniref:EH domain-containing protein n=1 Tax=Rickenella mellea TaxID=50990 RepID=A0A4Y7QBN9_9AGAM|nr:hypothetical protein BD410DRAFT_72211 [Rickenella mellea]
MAPTSAIQSRIQQFESLDGRHLARKSPVQYPPSSRVASTSLLDDPLSPTASSSSMMQPAIPYVVRKPRSKSASPSPPNLGLKTSLIDLKDCDDHQPHPGSQRAHSSPATNGLNGNKTKAAAAPPLPPRSLSNSSKSPSSSSPKAPLTPPLKPSSSRNATLTVEHTYPPLASTKPTDRGRQSLGHMHASSTSSFQSVSLSSDGGTDGEIPRSVSQLVATYSRDLEKTREENRTDQDKDSDSVDGSFSFENLSSAGLPSPSASSTHEWEKDIPYATYKPEPPKLPERSKPSLAPSPPPSIFSKGPPPPPPSSAHPSAPSSRRIAPPPPPPHRKPHLASHRSSVASTASASTSDRSSIFSTGTVTTAHTSISSYTHARLARATPVPPVAQKRYDGLFSANLKAQHLAIKNSQLLSPFISNGQKEGSKSPTSPRKGWRGLSVDLITNPEQNLPVDKGKVNSLDTGDDDKSLDGKLNGRVVKAIWSKSKLDKGKLREIWNECALPGEDSLDRPAFIRGMWRIDEELRRAQSSRELLSRGRMRPTVSTGRRANATPLLR